VTQVLHVITGLGMGGAETMLVQLATALQARNMSQHVVSLGALDARADDLARAGVGLTVLGARSPASYPAVARALAREVNAQQPRIIQGWMYHGNLAATFGHWVCRGRRRRRLMWNLRASNMDAQRYGSVIRLGALVSRQVDVVIANSEAGIAFHRARGFRPKRFVLIDNGIDTARFRPNAEERQRVRAELGIAADAIVAIHVARVDPMKDHVSFLAAMEWVPSVFGLMVGAGTQDLAVPPNVRAIGLRRDVDRLYPAADIVVSTSAFGEGFSNVIAEGMSAGLVPIATDVGDARRIVGDTGYIVPAGDAAMVARAIATEAAMPLAERSSHGSRARVRIVENFSLARAVEQYQRLYSA
jgi:glycosyltransferase involved in cell wall biosynthesis